jgi:hypothetical protein
MSNNSANSSIQSIQPGPASNDPLGLNNPTPIILALINKFILSMLLVANSALFHTLALNKKSRIPTIFSISISIIFIFLSVLLCSFATYEFIESIQKYINYCQKNSGCLYPSNMLIFAKNLYTIIAVLFSVACLSICILLLKNFVNQI